MITDEDMQEIRAALEQQPKVERTFQTVLADKEGEVYATVERLLHIRRKDAGPKVTAAP